MEKIGRVVSINGDKAKLEIQRASACGEKCGSCSGGCSSTGAFIEAQNLLNAEPGQLVKIEAETAVVMKAAFLAYIFPLSMLIAGIMLGSYIYKSLNLGISSEVFSLLLGCSFMVISYVFLKIIDRNIGAKNNINNKITKIL